jgi:hypothetical protein
MTTESREAETVPPPAVCPICQTWTMLPHAARHSTPVSHDEAYAAMVIGFWLATRGAKESDLCKKHQTNLINLDLQKHMQDQWLESERQRIEAEKKRAAENPYPPEHRQIAATLLGKIAAVNAPPPVADPNTFLCPTGCGKMLRNGEVHGCPGPALPNG